VTELDRHVLPDHPATATLAAAYEKRLAAAASTRS